MVSSCVLNDDAFPDALPGVGIFMGGPGCYRVSQGIE